MAAIGARLGFHGGLILRGGVVLEPKMGLLPVRLATSYVSDVSDGGGAAAVTLRP